MNNCFGVQCWLGLQVHLYMMLRCTALNYFQHNWFPLWKMHSLKENGSGAGGAAQRHGGAGLHDRHKMHHLNMNKCQVWGKWCFSHSRTKPKNTCSPFPVAKELSALGGWREGSTPWGPSPPPSSLSPLTAPGPPTVGRERTPQHCSWEALAQARQENCKGAILWLPAWGLEACRDLLLSWYLFY